MDYRIYTGSDRISIYKDYYASIHGGIDGYYEKTILDAEIYEVYEETILAYFSVYPERGLTSLFVLSKYQSAYDQIFDFVSSLNLFQNVLFSSNDQRFLCAVKKRNMNYEIQAYNFSVDKKVYSNIAMNSVSSDDYKQIYEVFGEFLRYNNIFLDKVQSFIYKEEGNLISFGAIEPLKLNNNRYCISMIVKEEYRRKGIGQETVKYLLQYLYSSAYEANARCYVLNEASKNTLIKSGLNITNFLYRVIDH